MRFDEYQKHASTFCLPTANNPVYLVTGLAAEAGEVAGIFAKWVRDETPAMDAQVDTLKELGDILWFVSQLATYMNIPLSEIAEANLHKLTSRKQKGTLKGSGNER